MQNFNQKKFNKNNYVLTFWVQGVNIFVTDIQVEAYKHLEVLYMIDNGMLKQYFTKKAYERALEDGLEFYNNKNAVEEYQTSLSKHCESFKKFFETKIENKTKLTKDLVQDFFKYTKELCSGYTKMNFEFTDKAFLEQEENSTIKENLSKVAKFKDEIRAFMNMVLFESGGYSQKLFSILQKQFDIQSSVLENLTQKEILALFDGKKPDKNAVLSRQEAFVRSYDMDGFYEREEAERILQEFREKDEQSDAIQGQVANKGKATGSVKIIHVNYSDLDRVNTEIEKMEQGSVLVAKTTAPELMVACKKAAAIVTDIGGLMSHAAIVSRELDIPCVVGTKNASKVLKDGDQVEVDGDIGIVKIL